MSRLLEVQNLQTQFPTRAGLVKSVNGVSFYIDEGELLGLVYSTYRSTSLDMHDQQGDTFTTMRKLFMTELAGRMSKLARDIAGDDFLDMSGPRLKWIERFMISLSMSIAGGTSNVQRNIIGERVLGLPRDRVPGASA